jgi:hypothetical protein
LNSGFKPREPRQKVVLPARMRLGGKFSDVCIRDISSRGMMLQAANPPPQGSYIEIYRAAHTIVARVVWSRERRFGIMTQDKMHVADIVTVSAPGGTRRPDQERRAGDRHSRAVLPPRNMIAEQADRSRQRSRIFEFGTLMAFGLICAGFVGSTAYDVMANPLRKVSMHLAKG